MTCKREREEDDDVSARAREFVAQCVPALAAAARAMSKNTRQPIGWALMLLRLAAERVDYAAQEELSAEEYASLRAKVLSECRDFRNTARTLRAADRAAGSEIVANALTDPLDAHDA